MKTGEPIQENGSEFVLKTLAEFCDGREDIKRRNYKTCYPIEVTVQTAKQALRGVLGAFDKKYNFANNNCENFATYLKTGVSESRQATLAGRIGSGAKVFVNQAAHTVMGIETGLSIAKTSAQSSRILNFFSKPFSAAPAISGLSKVCMILGPIAVALDVGMLVHDYKKDKADIVLLKAILHRLEERREWISQLEADIADHMQKIHLKMDSEKDEFEYQQFLAKKKLWKEFSQKIDWLKEILRSLWNEMKPAIFKKKY